jgi:lysyl-tRNA synthetase class 2
VTESSQSMFAPENLSDQELSRHRNLAALQDAGIEPYPARVRRSHTIADARALYETWKDAARRDGAANADEVSVSIAGRLKRIRVMGKMSFADLEDGTGQIQIASVVMTCLKAGTTPSGRSWSI